MIVLIQDESEIDEDDTPDSEILADFPKQTKVMASQVEAAPTCNRNLRTLAQKYRNIRNDIRCVIKQL